MKTPERMAETGEGAVEWASGNQALLVVGEKGSFSKKVIDYALEMAERMSYDILALNTAPLSCDTFKLFSSRNEICDEFKLLSEKNIVSFREAAIEKGISFNHKVMFNEIEEALTIINKEYEDIAFIVSETIEDRTENITEQRDRINSNLYVYSVV